MKCLEIAKAAYKDALSQNEIEDTFHKLNQAKENAIANKNDIVKELSDKGEQYSTDREFQLKAKKIQQYNSIASINNTLARIKMLESRMNPIKEGINSKLTGLTTGQFDSRNSTFLKSVVSQNKMLKDMQKDFHEANAVPIWNSKENELDIVHAILKANRGEAHENPAFAKIGSTISGMYKTIRKQLADLGIFYPELDDRVMRNIHVTRKLMSPTGKLLSDIKFKRSVNNDQEKIYNAARDRWKKFIYSSPENSLLQEKTFGNADVPKGSEDAFLNQAFDSLTNKGLFLDRPDSFGERLSHERVLHFTPEGLVKYNTEYGSGAIQDGILRELMSLKKSINVMNDWGTNPTNTLKSALKIAQDDPAFRHKLPTQRAVDQMFRLLKSLNHTPQDAPYSLNAISANLRAWQHITKLGSVVLKSIPDLALLGNELTHVAAPFHETFFGALQTVVEGSSNKEKAHLLDLLNVSKSHLIGSFVRFSEPNLNAQNLLSRSVRLMFKWNGLENWDYGLRGQAAMTHARYLALNRNVEFESIPDQYKTIMRSYGFDKPEWDVIRKSGTQELDKKLYIVPQGVQNVSRETISNYLREKGVSKVTDARVQQARDDLEQKLDMYFQDRTDHVIQRPDLIDQDMMRFGSEVDHPLNWLFQLMSQYKGFTLAFTRRVMGAKLYGQGAQTLGEAILGGKGDIQGLVRLSTSLMAYTYASMALTNLVQGKSPPSLERPGTWVKMFVEGPAGMWGSLLESMGEGDALGKVGKFIAGPTLSEVSQAISTPVGGIEHLVKDHFDEQYHNRQHHMSTSLGAVKILERNTPLINQFYTRWMLNNLIYWNLEDTVDPGARRKRLNQLKKQGVTQLF